jgi:monovalent cation:H+ antiporter-2, CPA2 family
LVGPRQRPDLACFPQPPSGADAEENRYTGGMETLPDFASYKAALIVLAAAGVVIPLFLRLKLSPALGFMLVGLVVGPFGLGALADVHPWLRMVTIGEPGSIREIADLGVVLLLFMIGLELSLERLWLMRRLVFGLGALQVVTCAVALAGASVLLGEPPIRAAVIGLALAMSSTAIALQVLAEEKRLGTPAGRASFAVLLFQDLAVVPVLFGLTALDPSSGADNLAGLGRAAAHALLAVAGIAALGRLVLRPLFRSVARAKSEELFIAACLLVVIATALATAAAGLSMALGALIGGLLLAGTEYRRQVEITIEPFKGLLVGLFLMSIGMSLDLHTLIAHPAVVLGAALGLVVLKAAIVAVLARGFELPWRGGVQAALLLGPGGEFSFVIVTVALAHRLVDDATAGIVLFVAALTMIATPLLSKLGVRLVPRAGPRPIDPALLLPRMRGDAMAEGVMPDGGMPDAGTADPTPDPTQDATLDTGPRVIVAGFGRVGQTVAALLEAHRVPYVAIDLDPDRVARERQRGRPIYYGDMARTELLRHLDLDTARALVVTLDDPAVAEALVIAARAARASLVIVARARDAEHAARLYGAGATDAVPETIEASLQLAEAALVDVGIAMGPVIASIHEQRAALQADIKAMAPAHIDIRPIGRRRLRDGARRGG